jgi:hypothetical protein
MDLLKVNVKSYHHYDHRQRIGIAISGEIIHPFTDVIKSNFFLPYSLENPLKVPVGL